MGINLLPSHGKLCNFDCIYCECGWNADGLSDRRIPGREEVRSALRARLESCLREGTEIDSITFSGDGEPTLNPDFPSIVRDTLSLRDELFPGAKVSVLSNATRLDAPGVFEALRLVDNPILKLDAPTSALAAVINRPAFPYDVEAVLEGMERFEGDFILQTMFLSCESFDSSSDEVLVPWKNIVRRLHPRQIMVYTIDRPTPRAGLGRFSEERMRSLVGDLAEEGFDIQIKA